jgi:nitrite reductase (NAD(P)H)
MKPKLWYTESNIDARIGERVDNIDTDTKKLHTEKSGWVSYDICVLATGSKAAVPPNAPTDVEGVFCYRTIEDIEKIVKWAAREDVETASIVGGGLLGLEAAKAALDLKLEVNIFERADRLMTRQLDNEASKVLESEINKLGITTNIGGCPDKVDTKLDYITKNQKITGLQLQQGGYLATDMLIYSIGISPYDQLSAASGNKIERAPRGGFLVKADMTTSVSDVYAIGECASYNGMCYGLIAPCNDMADILAKNLTSTIYNTKKAVFKGNDMSTKLKLMGVFVASFGDVFPDATKTTPLIYRDPFKNIYKKYIFSRDGKKILGGIMVGDTDDYNKVLGMTRSGRPIGCDPSELMFGAKNGEAEGVETLPDDAQICSCFNVTKGELRKAITSKGLTSVDQLKAATKAGTGCGGCVPAVTEIFESEMKASGKTITNNLCRDFTYSRAELYSIVKIKALHTFTEIVQHCATDKTTMGCEVCKPACGSIIASLYNENILESDRGALQDTNDRFMANIQRGGLYSVVPRIPAGEITPEKLAVIADVAKDYKLYSKITGAQRIDLFGARKEDLPDIWEKLVNAGFER